MSQDYIDEYEKVIVLHDGTRVFLRPLLPTDTDMLWDMFSTLSRESVDFLRSGFTREFIARWTANIDYRRHLPIVAVVEDEGEKKIVASATLSFVDAPAFRHKATLAIRVHDDYQNKGLGTSLTKHMLDIAEKRKLQKVSLGVRVDNARAIRIYEKCGVKIEATLKDEHFIDGKCYDDHIMSIFL